MDIIHDAQNKALLYFNQALISIDFEDDNSEMNDLKKKSNLILAAKIKAALERSPKTAKKIAIEVGVTPQAIIGWKKTGAISKDSLALFAHAVGMRLSDFIDTNDSREVEDPETQAVIDMMQATDLEGKILIKAAAYEALEKYLERKVRFNKLAKGEDLRTELTEIKNEFAKLNPFDRLNAMTELVQEFESQLKKIPSKSEK
ncbi:hypothetical protein [Undibacterium sp. Ji22W]|uniref:hypothetical protein n=1 Tax=Undibacterium sp. Ji22W TaxID=3413038 RepID=UPI003BF0A48D